MILSAIAERLKRRSKDDFKGRHFQASLILQAVSWYLRYPLSYRDIEELFRERGLPVDHATVNRWVLAYAPAARSAALRHQAPAAGDRKRSLSGQKAYAADRRLSILSHGTTNDPGVRSHAVAAEGL